MTDAETEKRLVGDAAAKLVTNRMALGIGSGSTVAAFIDAIGKRVAAENLTLRAIPTSVDTAQKCEKWGIDLVGFDEVTRLDLAVDGADEVSADFHMIKGGGGALLREKIVLTAAAKRVIIADSSKRVEQLGAFPLPVEVVPFGHEYVMETIAQTGATPVIRERDGRTFFTDNGNMVLDCAYRVVADPRALEGVLAGIPGVVETGLFLGLLDELIIANDGEIETIVADREW